MISIQSWAEGKAWFIFASGDVHKWVKWRFGFTGWYAITFRHFLALLPLENDAISEQPLSNIQSQLLRRLIYIHSCDQVSCYNKKTEKGFLSTCEVGKHGWKSFKSYICYLRSRAIKNSKPPAAAKSLLIQFLLSIGASLWFFARWKVTYFRLAL